MIERHSMNKDQLRQELADDEGCKYEIYLDHLNLPTFGIGHLITESDPSSVSPLAQKCLKRGCVKHSTWMWL